MRAIEGSENGVTPGRPTTLSREKTSSDLVLGIDDALLIKTALKILESCVNAWLMGCWGCLICRKSTGNGMEMSSNSGKTF